MHRRQLFKKAQIEDGFLITSNTLPSVLRGRLGTKGGIIRRIMRKKIIKCRKKIRPRYVKSDDVKVRPRMV